MIGIFYANPYALTGGLLPNRRLSTAHNLRFVEAVNPHNADVIVVDENIGVKAMMIDPEGAYRFIKDSRVYRRMDLPSFVRYFLNRRDDDPTSAVLFIDDDGRVSVEIGRLITADGNLL